MVPVIFANALIVPIITLITPRIAIVILGPIVVDAALSDGFSWCSVPNVLSFALTSFIISLSLFALALDHG